MDAKPVTSGPHSLACAARLRGCIASLVVAGQAPYHAEGLDFHAGQGELSQCEPPSFNQVPSIGLIRLS